MSGCFHAIGAARPFGGSRALSHYDFAKPSKAKNAAAFFSLGAAKPSDSRLRAVKHPKTRA